jgi:predicted MPP superfamily phosphohydrolase
LGLIVRQERLRRILAKVRVAAPDILVSTGDLVDGQMDSLAGLAELFQEVTPRYGKFAVTGNHEIYAGLRQAISFTERAGFRMLQGKAVRVANCITLAGIDDPAVGRTGEGTPPEHNMLSNLSREDFVIFLKHRPAVENASLGLFDLQLSGHVHKGQIWPFNLVTHLFYPVAAGYSIYPQKSSLYVNRGSGTWGPPIRFLAPPEVTVIELVPSGSTG